MLARYGDLLLRPISGIGHNLVVTASNQNLHKQTTNHDNPVQSKTGLASAMSAEFKIETLMNNSEESRQ